MWGFLAILFCCFYFYLLILVDYGRLDVIFGSFLNFASTEMAKNIQGVIIRQASRLVAKFQSYSFSYSAERCET